MVKHTLDQPIDIVVRLYVYYSVKRLNESNMAIYKAFLKYGHSNFKLEILEYCEKENALFREQHYIDLLKPEYNINPIAGSSLGYKHTEQSLALMGGWERSEEMKAKMSASQMGRKKSLESRAKMSASKMGNSNAKNHPNSLKIEVTDLEKDTSTIYNSMREAAKALNIHVSIISRYFSNNQKKPYKKRYVFIITKET